MESIKSDDLVIKSDDFYVGKPRLKNVCGANPKTITLRNVVATKLVDVNFFSCRHGLPRVEGSEFFFLKIESIKSDYLVKNVCGTSQKIFTLRNVVAAKLVYINFFLCRHRKCLNKIL